MSQTFKIITTAIITAIVVGSGVYYWQRIDVQSPEQVAEVTTLTKEYLVSGKWGQEGPYGMQIKFNADGTFNEHLAAETGDLPVSGSFEVEDNGVSLRVEKYADLPYDEAEEKFGLNAVYMPDRTLTLEESDSSLFFTHYLENKGHIAYWNKLSEVPGGEAREFESNILITTQQDLEPKVDATFRSRPHLISSTYSFNSCDPTCETGPDHELSEIYNRVLARTQFKDELNGVEDYWYLAQVTVPWYSVAKLNNESLRVSIAWLHGSELE